MTHSSDERGAEMRELFFETAQELLQSLSSFVAARGRLPEEAELEAAISLREVFGSLRRAFEAVQSVTGHEQWAAIQRERAQDLLVYLALERFSGRPRFSVLPRALQLDVKAFFGTYTRACEAADRFLFSVGDMAAGERTRLGLFADILPLSGHDARFLALSDKPLQPQSAEERALRGGRF